jgi:NAD dependent epimerase/dehydratase family enzyme
MPWIHVKDVANLHIYAIEHPAVRGVLNAVAPEIVTNLQFTKALGAALHVFLFYFIKFISFHFILFFIFYFYFFMLLSFFIYLFYY